MEFTAGFLLFPELTQLDLTGPFEVLSRLPKSRALLIAQTLEPVRSDCGLRILPDVTFETAPKLDLLCIPGGPGTLGAMQNPALLAYIRAAAEAAQLVTSVCTGSLLLGAAGVLRGRRAACHWAFRDLLSLTGAIPDPARVVEDGRFITGGGVTAGLDFALTLLARLQGAAFAQSVQLALEYDPAPPFNAGSPERAPPALIEAYRTSIAASRAARAAALHHLHQKTPTPTPQAQG